MVWGKKSKVYLITLTLIIFTPLTIFANKYTECKAEFEPFFEMDLLMPNTSAYQPPYWELLSENLPYIGGKVDTIDHTGWAQISPRTWGYPGPYPIPPYDKGGYDVLFVGWSFGFDYSPFGLFDSSSITPIGDNFFQYNCQEMDWAIYNYTNSYSAVDRAIWGREVQKLLYRDLPSIAINYYERSFVHDENLTGWDPTLWAGSYMPMTNWTIPGQTEFSYATPADFEDFQIYKYESVYDAQWLNQIYNGLVVRQPSNYSWVPAIATDFHTENGLNWTVSIDPNARWCDGTPLTALDVNYSYNLQLTQGYNPDYAYWSRYLGNNSICIFDNYTLQINFIQPYTFQDSNLALPLIPMHIWSQIDPNDHEAQAIDWAINDPSKIFGAGPYCLEEYDGTNGIIHLKKNPYHCNFTNFNDPYFDNIKFDYYSNKESAITALLVGTIDMVDAQFSVSKDDISEYDLHYSLAIDPGYREMAINNQHPVFGSGELCPIAGPDSARYVRKAISHIMDRQKLIDDYYTYWFASPAATSYPKIAPGYDDKLLPDKFSIEIAQHYMELAGYDISKIKITSYVLGYNWVALLSILGLLGFWMIRKTKLFSK